MKRHLPKISIITPSCNQAEFLEEAIRSVLSQDYPDSEYIIIDCASTDGSADIIRKYEKNLAYWVSEKDRGQTHAINKGLEKITGEVWAYLNSDDLLEPGALAAVGEFFANNPEKNWLAGRCRIFGKAVEPWILTPHPPEGLLYCLTPWERPDKYVFPASQASFMRRRVIDKCGFFDESYHYSMDIEYYARAVFSGGFRQYLTDKVLGSWRWHANSKTWEKGCAYAFRADEIRIAQKYARYLSAGEQKLLKKQIKGQKKWVQIREAMWLAKSGQRKKAAGKLLKQLITDPSAVCFRPWLGAARRVAFS